jgi:putative transposase
LAGERPRFGYRRLYIFLRREKTAHGTLRWPVNHKRVYRLYREEGLAMQRRRRKKFRAEARVPLALPTRANEMWTMDYTHDEMAGGRKFRTLNLMDSYTREALRIEPDTSLPGLRVVRVLEGLRERRGTLAAPLRQAAHCDLRRFHQQETQHRLRNPFGVQALGQCVVKCQPLD